VGQLIVWHYRTTLFAKLADHTYVTCGNLAKGWSCWGGKTGGTILRQGTGSTARADAIAEPDEKAGISCYLINGVCHQAANRILFPAEITVRGARGYGVSEALFGTYGRPRALFGLCKAPFNKHPGVSGDIPECTEQTAVFSPHEMRMLEVTENDQDPKYQAYLTDVSAMYEQQVPQMRTLETADVTAFQLQLFDRLIGYKLGDTNAVSNLLEIRESEESARIEVETIFENRELSPKEFLRQTQEIEENFQLEVANALSEEEYGRLLDLQRGDIVYLGDPDIVREVYS
jgi:hypothetical protein